MTLDQPHAAQTGATDAGAVPAVHRETAPIAGETPAADRPQGHEQGHERALILAQVQGQAHAAEEDLLNAILYSSTEPLLLMPRASNLMASRNIQVRPHRIVLREVQSRLVISALLPLHQLGKLRLRAGLPRRHLCGTARRLIRVVQTDQLSQLQLQATPARRRASSTLGLMRVLENLKLGLLLQP